MSIVVKRVYEPVGTGDGYRVLVDRLWPRGLSKKQAAIDLWLRDIAPSTALRRWFGHEPSRWAEFQSRYRAEYLEKPELLKLLGERALSGRVTLLYSARDTRRNQAVALKSFLSRRLSQRKPSR